MTDARVESFLADALALEGENPDAIREGVCRPWRLRRNLQSAGSEQTYEGQGGSRLPRPLSRSHCRGNTTPEGDGDGRAFEVSVERYGWATFPGQSQIALVRPIGRRHL